MTTELTIRRDHLGLHRRTIIGRSLAAALANAIPVPFLDARLCYLVQRSTLRTLARDSQVDLDEEAAQAIIYGPSAPPRLLELVTGPLALRLLARSWRNAFLAYVAVHRGKEAVRYFLTATLFDHYCKKLHVGLGLDRETGMALRAIMDEAIACTPGALGQRMFRRALTAAARATVRAPVELLDIASRGAFGRLLAARSEKDEIAAAEEIETQLERHLASHKGFLARATAAVEIQLSAEQNPYLDELIDHFERIWYERRGKSP